MDTQQNKAHREIILELLRNGQNPNLFESLDDSWKDDDTIAKEALKINPLMCVHISERLKLDRELALFVVKVDINTIRLIPKRFSREKEFLIDAVKDNGALFRKIHKSFKGVKEIAYWALKDDPTIVPSFSDYLMEQIGRNDPLKFLEASLLFKELEAETSENRSEPKKIKI